MSKYTNAALLFTLIIIPSCSDDSDKQECPQLAECPICETCQQCPTCKEGDECPACPAQNCPACPTCKEGDECPACHCQDCTPCKECPICETCQECQQCPTCKEGDECPACPSPSCPTCPTCKECDECPACPSPSCPACPTCKECDECPTCNDDKLNAQLTSCNNELTTTKQALKTEQDANESCVRDLDTCKSDLSELSAKPRSKSGSRLIFKEHKMSDGSVFVEPYPYDTLLNANCSFLQTDFGMCCIPSAREVTWDIASFQYLYRDSSCSERIANLAPAEKYGVITNNCPKIGDLLIKRGTYNYCTENYENPSVFKIKSIYTMYQKLNDSCVKYEIDYPLVELESASAAEAKSYFVCEE